MEFIYAKNLRMRRTVTEKFLSLQSFSNQSAPTRNLSTARNSNDNSHKSFVIFNAGAILVESETQIMSSDAGGHLSEMWFWSADNIVDVKSRGFETPEKFWLNWKDA